MQKITFSQVGARDLAKKYLAPELCCQIESQETCKTKSYQKMYFILTFCCRYLSERRIYKHLHTPLKDKSLK